MKSQVIFAAAIALAAAPALAQTTQPAPTPAPEAQQQQQQPAIQSVNVVDITELPAETQAQVEQIEEQRTEQDLQNLRDSIDASPEIVAALEEKGATSEHVVAASLSQDGALTLVTRKPS
ncbi:MAG: hypothetical protein K5872_02845 [Rhizobiaceae bacterium]|nr:hypothetical protein [Rhizobiaceae bacterium]MCV0405147.1 hypothetical protein [Rhizobiaceae bacterium]